MSRAWLLVVVPALLLPCCANFGLADEEAAPSGVDGLDGATSSSDGAILDGAAPVDDDGASDGAADGSDASVCDPACKGTVAPCGIPVTTAGKTFCIDPTEVTVARYKKFLVAHQGVAVPLPSPCGNTQPVARPFLADNEPVTNVTWCEAVAYCTWAGKRLCGTLDGTPLTANENATQRSAWYHACTAGSSGHKLLNGTPCRLGNGVGPLASGTTCEGGYAGLFDMPGNAWEWVNYPVGNNAFFVGNGFSQPAAGDTCATASNTPIDNPLPDVGFRCCSY